MMTQTNFERLVHFPDCTYKENIDQKHYSHSILNKIVHRLCYSFATPITIKSRDSLNKIINKYMEEWK